ncbi:transketolase C-terminal domain-containing protein [Streptosporangium lutulentum]
MLKQWLETVCRLNPHTVHVINSDTSYPFDPQLDPGETRTDLSQCAGINEIGAFNLARGVSQSGGYPIYVSPGVHLECCSDEFRLASLHQDPMLVVGFNTGSYLGHWGPTYVSRRDLETYRAPGVDIVQPATTGDLTSVLNALPASARPTYLRLPHRLLDFPAAREACVSDGLYRMTAATQHPEDVVIVATGMAVPVALAAAQALTRVGRECAVLNVVRLTRLDPATLSQHIGKAPYLCVLVDGETTSLELSVRKSSAVDQLVTAIDLSERQLSASEWWLRNPIDHTGHVLDEIMAVLLSMQ